MAALVSMESTIVKGFVPPVTILDAAVQASVEKMALATRMGKWEILISRLKFCSRRVELRKYVCSLY